MYKVFGVQLFKNNARTPLSHILSIFNSDWLQHVRSVRVVYEFDLNMAAAYYKSGPIPTPIFFGFVTGVMLCEQ